MNCKLRHISLPLIAGLAYLASCTSEHEPVSAFARSDEEMKFEVVGATRVVATTNENVIDKPFMLFGDVFLKGDAFQGLTDIFNWDRVTYRSDIEDWDCAGDKQYWYMGMEHSFVAMHPFIEKGDPQVSILTYEENKLSFMYTLPDKMEDACDLLFATHRRIFNLDNSEPVRFEFRHLLARINFSIGLIEKELMYDHVDKTDTLTNKNNKYNENEFIRVHSVDFYGIKTRGSFTFSPSNLTGKDKSTYHYVKEYYPNENDPDIIDKKTVELKQPNKVPNSYKEGSETDIIEYVTALTDQEVIVMLPQEFGPESDAKMVVNYSINDDVDLMRKIVIPLKNATWKEGVSYTYKFLIDKVYLGHTIDEGKITVDIDDFRLHGEDGEEDPVGDDSWITDADDPGHNISYGYEEGEGGSCGPTN